MGKQIAKKDFYTAIAVAAKNGKTLVDVAATLGVEYNTVYQRWNKERKILVEKFEAAGKDVNLIPTIPTGNTRGRPSSEELTDFAEDLFGGELLNTVDTSEVIKTASEDEYAAAQLSPESQVA